MTEGPDVEDESWRDADLIEAVRSGEPLGSMSRQRLLELIEARSASPSREDGLDGRLRDAYRWIVQTGLLPIDHACPECIPDGPLVDPTFRCTPHVARAALDPTTEETA